jgi:hypothetical protein
VLVDWNRPRQNILLRRVPATFQELDTREKLGPGENFSSPRKKKRLVNTSPMNKMAIR